MDHEDAIGHNAARSERAIEIALAFDASGFWETLWGLIRHHTSDSSLIHDLGIGDKLQEFLITLESPKLLGQLFHRIDRIHRIQCSPNHRDRMVGFRIMQ